MWERIAQRVERAPVGRSLNEYVAHRAPFLQAEFGANERKKIHFYCMKPLRFGGYYGISPNTCWKHIWLFDSSWTPKNRPIYT